MRCVFEGFDDRAHSNAPSPPRSSATDQMRGSRVDVLGLKALPGRKSRAQRIIYMMLSPHTRIPGPPQVRTMSHFTKSTFYFMSSEKDVLRTVAIQPQLQSIQSAFQPPLYELLLETAVHRLSHASRRGFPGRNWILSEIAER